jgi:hypothetical protein
MEDISKKEAEERLKYYKAIHASHLYKNIIKVGGKPRWEMYLTARFGVSSCKNLDLQTLKTFSDSIYKKGIDTQTSNKVISLLPYINQKEQKQSGTEGMTNRQKWTINRDWNYMTQYLNPENSPRKALNTYIKRVCGENANFENLTKKQASKLITAIQNWIKSIEGKQ